MKEDYKYNFLVDVSDANSRIDVVLSKELNISRAKAQKLINKGWLQTLINSKWQTIKDCDYKVKANEEFFLQEVNLIEEIDLVATPIDIDILYEDDHLLIVNKPVGLVVHPGAGNFTHTLVNGLLYKYQDKLSSVNGAFRPGIVHRLDKDTSGVLVVAKDDNTHNFLAEQFATHTIERSYRAFVWKVPQMPRGEVNTCIKRSDSNRQKMVVHKTKGKQAITLYNVVDKHDDCCSLMNVTLKTGRTHQIRVHMAYLGHHIVGDSLYGKRFQNIKINDENVKQQINALTHQALHAYKLGFTHPEGHSLLVEQAEPKDLQDIYSKIFSKYNTIKKSEIIIGK